MWESGEGGIPDFGGFRDYTGVGTQGWGAPERGANHRLTVGGLSPSGRHGFLNITVIDFKIYIRGINHDMSFKATDSPEVHTALLTVHTGCGV